MVLTPAFQPETIRSTILKNQEKTYSVICKELRMSQKSGLRRYAESRHAVTISTGQELIEKINENPNGFYVLEKDISMADINLTGEVYIDKTFIGKLQGNGHKITDAQGPLFAKIANSYVSDLTIVNKEGETKDWFGKTKQYTIIVNEQKKETVQEIKTLEELKTVGQNKYTKYVLKNDIDASSVTTETAVVKGIFKGEFDGGGFTIKGLKKPLFEKFRKEQSAT